ncbi:acyl-CoA dehydrogenase family protein [Peribacillus frigoritolerans]|uniref:acyl-CoA dehydrogenase family protein n=1 Tax=Peribacillus frigoritolerans TaxID=450367 RepID=UPI0038239EC1
MTNLFFTEVHEELRKVIRRFVSKEVTPFIEEWEEAGRFPTEMLRQLAELGVLGARFPEKVGGQDGNYFMSLVLFEELARCGAGGILMSVAAQAEMATPPIFQFGSANQQEQFLRPAILGEKVAALAFTEPDFGLDLASIQTRAVRDGDHWVINGRKTYVINGTHADFILLAAQTSQDEGQTEISLFVVETDLPGFSVFRRLETVGMRTSEIAEIMLEEVRLPHRNLLGEQGKGYEYAMWTLQGVQLIEAISAVSLAQVAFDLALDYANTRHSFGRPIGQNQVISHLLTKMSTRLEAARQLIYRTTFKYSEGKVTPKEIAIAKLEASRLVSWVADRALQIYGGNGYMAEFPIERIWRDVRMYSTGIFGRDENLKEIIAQELGI